MSWPSHAFDQPVLIPVEGLEGEIYISGVGWHDDLPTGCKELGFTHILNCAGWFLRNQNYKSHPFQYDIQYAELDLNDVPEQRLDIFVNHAFHFIDFAMRHKGKILIHCFFGQSRSVSMLCYYLMKKMGWSYDQTLEHIRKYRSVAEPNKGFETFLKSV